jgi:dipeptidyl aminopeptidase/acylaminoacyl peptidase
MTVTRVSSVLRLLALLALVAAPSSLSAGPGDISVTTADGPEAPYQRGGRGGGFGPGVYKAQVTPHWFHDNTRFWYRNDLASGAREFILVDAEAGTRQPAFDHKKLAAALSSAADKEYKADHLPFDSIDFANEDKAVRFRVGGATWTCDLSSYACSRAAASDKPAPADEPASGQADAVTQAREESPWAAAPSPEAGAADTEFVQLRQPDRPTRSPDGAWSALVKENNVYLRDRDGKETQLTRDGTADAGYGALSWAPDSKALVAFRSEPGDRKEVYLVESSPKEGGRAKLHTRRYDLPGDKFATYEPHLFDPAGGKEVKCAAEKTETGHPDYGYPRLRWARGGHTFTYQKADRGHQRFRLIEVDAVTGQSRNLIDETTKTFIWTAHPEAIGLPFVTWLQKGDEIVYSSERDGWRHLYLIDAKEGKVKNQITRGDYVVRGIERIDETSRQIEFRASGRNEGQDPYLIHYYRINFDGTGLVALTEGNGSHSVAYSPDRKYLIDTYSRVDLPPINELRRASDGKLVCKLEEADVSALKATGWEPPEVFSAKGRDGKTDIWGVISRPRRFDPTKKYAVLEDVYAGPQSSFVPKTFSAFRRYAAVYAALNDLGFVVAKIDGMGTAHRSKAFHDVCWHNLADAGFPDRILWHKAVAAKYPHYDVSRVGIYGTSAGGQNAAGAVLFHGDFYKAAVAACGCHDNRMDKASWNEQWMGYPVGPHYAACSNIDNAAKLKGKLMLIVGEMDTTVPPESTMRLADALIKAGKDFDLIVVPGMGHSNGGAYGTRRMQDFFVRHLQGAEPPNRN